MALRVIFCGTPAFALPTLHHLIAQPDFQLTGVVTQPDRLRGRRQRSASSPVKDAALEAGIAVYQPEKIKSESAYDYLKRVAPDVVVIIAYGQIIPGRLIELPRLGWVNLHASMLPKYRGAAPINWAIAKGETRTGLTTMQIDTGLDTGPVLLKREWDIGADETAPELTARLAEAGAPLVADTLRKLERGELKPTPQDHSQATHAPALKKEDGRIDWSLASPEIYNRIRGFQPWPGTFTQFRGRICRIWGRPAAHPKSSGAPGELSASDAENFVTCGAGTTLRLEFAQVEGRKKVTAQEFANGARIMAGERFGV